MTINKTLLILGAGGHAGVVADCALATGRWSDIAFLDDRFPVLSAKNHWPVIGKLSDLESYVDKYPDMALGLGVSYEVLRLELLAVGRSLGVMFPSLIHPAATVSPFAKIGDGSVVFAGAVININACIGEGCIINTSSSVDHDCSIGNGAHISPGAVLAGAVSVGERVWVGLGAKLLQSVSVGDDAVVGAGAVVLSDVTSGQKVVGVPAQSMVRL